MSTLTSRGVRLSHTHLLGRLTSLVNRYISHAEIGLGFRTLQDQSISGRIARRVSSVVRTLVGTPVFIESACTANTFTEKMQPDQADRTEVGAKVSDEHVTSYTETIGIVKGKAATPNLKLVAGTDPYPPGEVSNALTRSYEIDDVIWDTTKVRGDLLQKYEFPQDLWTPFILDKTKYFFYFRAKVRFTIRVNCTKFDYGCLLVSLLPYYQAGQSMNFREANLYAQAQNNPKMLSIQQGATLEFEIPWVSPNAYMKLDSTKPEIGTVFLTVLHPLSSASADPPSSVHLLIYAQFVEPELAGYTPDVATGPVPTARLLTRNRKPNAKTQSDKRTIFDESVTKSAEGIIDGVAEATKGVVAVIGSVGKMLGEGLEVAESIGGLVTGLGLNKPTSVEAVKPCAIHPNADLSYVSGLDYGPKFSLRPDYEIATKKGIIDAEDPRPSVLDMIKRPCLLACGSFRNSTAPGASITSWTCDPQAMIKLVTTVDGTSYQPTYLAWFTSFFSRWRGGLKYMVRFNCSSFMSCRVRLVHLLEPFLTLPLSAISGDVVSQVVDINGDREVTFTIPYLSDKHYQYTHTVAGTVQNSIGYVDMYLETPIVSPDTSADPLIYYDIWVAAADDFRLGGLISPTFGLETALVNSDPSALARSGKKKMEGPRIKKGKIPPNAKTQCDPITVFKKPFDGLIKDAKFVVEHGLVNGEDVGPVTNPLHRFVLLESASTRCDVAPGNPDDNGIDSFGNRFEFDIHTLWMMPWRFWRGSTRYYMMDESTNYWSQVVRLPYQNLSLPWLGPGVNWDYYGCYYNVANSSQTGWVNRGEIPWHANTVFREMLGTIGALLPTHVINFQGIGPSPAIGSLKILYALGDDISLGGVGALPALVNPLELPPGVVVPKKNPFVTPGSEEYE